jgi:hypothetical protein
MKYIFASLLVLLVSIHAGSRNPYRLGQVDYCRLYGTVYVERDRAYADFRVFVEEDEGAADLSVYLEDNALYADQSGIWFFTKDRNQAQYRIYLEKTKSFADFSIGYTTARSFAGCR